MLTPTLLVLGSVLLVLVLADSTVKRLPLTPALVYLVVGWAAGALVGAPSTGQIVAQAPLLTIVTEVAVLVSLLAVGLRLRVPPKLRAWRAALLLAGPGVVLAIAAGAVLAVVVLGLPWPAAVLLAAVLAPTDPVLASEVQVRSAQERDALRLTLTTEGGLNDASVLPAVMLGLGLLGLHHLGEGGIWASAHWWWHDMLWPIGGGAAIGVALGLVLGHALKARAQRGDALARDELLYAGAVALAYGVARATATSTFVVVFMVGVTLLEPFRAAALADDGQALLSRLYSFGARIERLVEAATVLAVGVALHAVPADLQTVLFGVLLAVLVRPLSVWMVLWPGADTTTPSPHRITPHQRRLMAWFGIRGVGSLFYLALALEHGLEPALAETLVAATLVAIALSVVLHGVSATPLMDRYHLRRGRKAAPPQPAQVSAQEPVQEPVPPV